MGKEYTTGKSRWYSGPPLLFSAHTHFILRGNIKKLVDNQPNWQKKLSAGVFQAATTVCRLFSDDLRFLRLKCIDSQTVEVLIGIE
jgi:hypothetical protein